MDVRSWSVMVSLSMAGVFGNVHRGQKATAFDVRGLPVVGAKQRWFQQRSIAGPRGTQGHHSPPMIVNHLRGRGL